MVEPDVVAYLQANLKNYPIEQLRSQLASEGVSEVDFDEALKAALRGPAPGAAAARAKPKGKAAALFLVVGIAAIAGLAAFVALTEKPEAPSAPVSSGGDSAFVGATGYVVHLPKDYSAVARFKDRSKTTEVVHFCKTGTDPTNFLNEGLFGQLGIVRLEVEPSALAGNLNGAEMLGRIVTSRLTQRGDKFLLKNLQVSSLRGIQVIVELPDPGVYAYLLGETHLYHFTAGQDDEIYRDILTSLREPNSEN